MHQRKHKMVYFLVGLILISGIGIGGKMYMDNKRMNEEMLKVVKSEEAKKVFEEGLKNLDAKAFTPEGVIQTYEIDYDSIKHNPMGGINGKLYVNNDSKLVVLFHLNKTDGKNFDADYVISGNSHELEQKLKGGSSIDLYR